MNFGFTLSTWVSIILPTYMRTAVTKAYLKVLATPLFGYYLKTEAWYNAKVAELTLNALTDVMQARLRVLYPDVGSFKVFVKTQWDNYPQEYMGLVNGHHKPQYVYTLGESQPPIYSWLLSERNLPHDYFVIVPTTYTAQLPDITSFCNRYRPAGKRFLIQFQNITA